MSIKHKVNTSSQHIKSLLKQFKLLDIQLNYESEIAYAIENNLSRLIKENNISSKITRKFKATTYSNHNFNVAPNLLKQDFDVKAPKTVYAGDITYIGTDEGWLYLATVIDLFNREIVGWSMNSTMTRTLVIDAFNAAIFKESPAEGFIFHSDRGVQYASYDYQHLLARRPCGPPRTPEGN